MMLPFPLFALRKFSASSRAVPTSLSLTTAPFSSLMSRLLKSVSVVSLPNVLIVNSLSYPSILPEGNSTFSRCNANFTSLGEIWKAVNLSGSN